MFRTKEQIIKQYSKAILIVGSVIVIVALNIVYIVPLQDSIPVAVIINSFYYLWG